MFLLCIKLPEIRAHSHTQLPTPSLNVIIQKQSDLGKNSLKNLYLFMVYSEKFYHVLRHCELKHLRNFDLKESVT